MRLLATATWSSGVKVKMEPPVLYQDPNTAKHFLWMLRERRCRRSRKYYASHNPSSCLRRTGGIHKAMQDRHISGKPSTANPFRILRHGKYRGAVYKASQFFMRFSSRTTPIPVIVNNLQSYDAHLLMQPTSQTRKVSISSSTFRYLLPLWQLRFIDSIQFVTSLGKLTNQRTCKSHEDTSWQRTEESCFSGRSYSLTTIWIAGRGYRCYH